MNSEEILKKITDLGISVDKDTKEKFEQIFEDRENIESALKTDWTYYRYLPENLQNDPEIIRWTISAIPKSLLNNDDNKEMSQEVQRFYDAIEESNIYDNEEKQKMNEILFQLDNSNLSNERKDFFIRELDGIMYDFDMNRRDRFTNEEEYFTVRNQIDQRLRDLLKKFKEENYNIGRNAISSNADVNVAKRELEKYFRSIGDRSFRITVHSDEEILQIYNNLLNNGSLNRNNNNNNDNSHNNGNDNGNVEDKINKFKDHLDKLEKSINKVISKLLLGDGSDSLNINNEIIELGRELDGLSEEAKQLISEIDEFKEQNFGETPSLTVPEIEKAVKEFKEKFKNLKISQVDKYNSMVNYVKSRIDELSSLTDVPDNIKAMIEELKGLNLDTCNTKVGDYRNTKYLDDIKYDDLAKAYDLLNKVDKERGKDSKPNKIDLDGDIKHIEEGIDKIAYYVEIAKSDDEVEQLKNDSLLVSDNINYFMVKLESNKDKLTEEEYNKYLERVELAQNDLYELNNKIKIIKPIKYSLYDEFNNRLDHLSRYVDTLNSLIDASKGLVGKNTISAFQHRIDRAFDSLDEINNEIETAHNENKLDDVQYNNLKERVEKIQDNLIGAEAILSGPDMLKNDDNVSSIDSSLDKLEFDINTLEGMINRYDSVIKRKDRKPIQRLIKKIEMEIDVIKKYLKKHDDINEHDNAVERLNNLENKFKNINGKYREKCPLMVKKCKSAKNWLKNHKKIALIAAGLAALAVELAVGPVIIPAIMRGNILIGNSVPSLMPITFALDKVLGSIIGATYHMDKGTWLLNGIEINPSIASSALLKGVAITSVGSSLVVPTVAAIKTLHNKMKKHKLKKELFGDNNSNNISDNRNVKDAEQYKGIYDAYVNEFDGSIEEFVNFYEYDKSLIPILKELESKYGRENRPIERDNGGHRNGR